MKSFLSATGLVWCGLIALIIIGIVYILKKRENEEKINHLTKMFMLLYIITLLLLLFEFVLQNAFKLQELYPLYTLIASKIYIYLGLVWSFIIVMYFIFLHRINTKKENTSIFYKKINTLVISILIAFLSLVIYVPITTTFKDGGFWVLSGPLNTIYNRLALLSDIILIIFIVSNRKNIPKDLVIYSLCIFGLYTMNFWLESLYGYYIKDSIFLYSLFILSLYYTTENQDKKIIEEYEIAKETSLEVDKQKTKFLLNMSHEIRTPLNTILGYSDYLLMDEHFTKEKIESEGQNVYQASEILLTLINNILDISRIESGKETLVENDYKLENLIINLYDKTMPKAALRNNVKFNIEVDETLPANYHGDLAKIERVLLSILYNAVEHTTMGEVRLKVNGEKTEEGIDFTFLIKNAGHEMKEDKFNVDLNTITSLDTTENVDNNILGIIIAKQLLNILGGNIEFINQPRKGTQYIIKLSQKSYGEEQVENVVEKIKKANEEELVNCEGKVALVADDNQINLTIAKRLLVKFGFIVETCLSGQECLELAKQKEYDMIFLDHMMPGMDGVETLNNLKEQHGKIPPTIALTANASDDSRNEYISLGFDDYLTKPIDMKELNKILKNIFENK